MGSKFIDIYVADPDELHALVRGDDPERLDALVGSDSPPKEELLPAFEVMRRGTFCFLPKGQEHPEGIVYCRAFEFLLDAVGIRWGIECYPDESEHLLWDLAFGTCEASWLTLPQSEYGVGVIAWRAPTRASSFAAQARGMASSGSFNERYVSASTLQEVDEACSEGRTSNFGIFTIYQA